MKPTSKKTSRLPLKWLDAFLLDLTELESKQAEQDALATLAVLKHLAQAKTNEKPEGDLFERFELATSRSKTALHQQVLRWPVSPDFLLHHPWLSMRLIALKAIIRFSLKLRSIVTDVQLHSWCVQISSNLRHTGFVPVSGSAQRVFLQGKVKENKPVAWFEHSETDQHSDDVYLIDYQLQWRQILHFPIRCARITRGRIALSSHPKRQLLLKRIEHDLSVIEFGLLNLSKTESSTVREASMKAGVSNRQASSAFRSLAIASSEKSLRIRHQPAWVLHIARSLEWFFVASFITATGSALAITAQCNELTCATVVLVSGALFLLLSIAVFHILGTGWQRSLMTLSRMPLYFNLDPAGQAP